MSAGEKVSPNQFYYHLTDNPKFALDPEHVPADNAMAIRQREGRGLYVAQDPYDVERWVNGHGYLRPYVAEISAPKESVNPERWSGEGFMPAENFGSAQVNRVIPIDAHAREVYGGHGWVEDTLGTTFDTGEEIAPHKFDEPMSSIYPFKGYRYSGPDVRDMPKAETQRHAERAERAAEHRGSQ
jgi:hypothetical protein